MSFDVADLGIRVITLNKPLRGTYPLVIKTISNIPEDIKRVIPPLNVVLRRVLYHDNLKSRDIGLWSSYHNEIHVATTYYCGKDEYRLPEKQIVNTVLHELGHAVEDMLGDSSLSHNLFSHMDKDIRKLNHFEKKRCSYFINDESEMFAECFAHLAGSQFSIAMTSKEFKKEFPNSIKEVKRRIKELDASLTALAMMVEE